MADETFAQAGRVLKWLFAAALLASLLFAHGCHGNEDHELFTRIVAAMRPIQQIADCNRADHAID